MEMVMEEDFGKVKQEEYHSRSI